MKSKIRRFRRTFLTPHRKAKRYECICVGGPFNKKKILLAFPRDGTLPFMNGRYVYGPGHNEKRLLSWIKNE